MKCHRCKEDKLSEEFPFYAPSENCDHALLHCLKCVTNEIKQSNSCSQCKSEVASDSDRYTEYMNTLDILFPKVQKFTAPVSTDGKSWTVKVTNLAGECTNEMYKPDLTIQDLKEKVESEMHIPCEQQMLLYNGVELKTKGDYGKKQLTLADHKVEPNSTIHLLVRLYEVPAQLDLVIFELSWGFPLTGEDYLDATVFLYDGAKLVGLIDYKNRAYRVNKSGHSLIAVEHTGDMVDKSKQTGAHTISVSIKSLPPHIDKLVFTLSSWNSPNISQFRNPSLRFFDKKFPNHQLCSDKMEDAANSQAIIMCCLSKSKGSWEVLGLKATSNGNAKDYSPLITKIANVIQSNYFG